jgi:hypothetical protein
MKLREYAERHGISPSTARRRAQRGKIPGARKVPGGVREDGTVYHAYWEVPDPDGGGDSERTQPAGGGEAETSFQLADTTEVETCQTCQDEQPQRETETSTAAAGGRGSESESSLVGILLILGLGLLAQVFGRR